MVELSFSSEYLLDRWGAVEVLSHDEGAVDLARLLEVGTVLFNHGFDPRFGKLPLAKIEKAWVDTKEHKGRATVTFDDDEDSEIIYQKVIKGMLPGVSVRYKVSNWEEVAPGKKSTNGRFTGPAYIATKWAPTEISFEPVPADPTVGVGRSIDEPPVAADGRADTTNSNKEDRTMPDERNTETPAAVDEAAVREGAIRAERQRVAEVSALCRDFGVDPVEHINSGVSVDQVRTVILEKIKAERKPTPAAAPDVRVEQEESEKFRSAASDALLLRAGKTIEKPADGARDLRGMKLRDLAIECVIRIGRTNAHRLDDDALFREALSPDSQFAGILSNAVNKTMATAYRAANTTYQAWTGRGSNVDFKPTTAYQISEAGDLLPITQTGEFKFDEISDSGVSKSLATFGKSWGFTRKALVDDDLGMLTRVPEAYVRAAGRGINKLVYKQLNDNVAIYDGTALFHATHKNLAAAGDYIETAAVGAGRAAMRKQKNLRGKETLNIAPTYLLVPAARETDAQKFLWSIADPSSNNAGVVNVFRNSLTPVVDAELDETSEIAWYLAAAPGDIDTIEVTYLNGNDMPILESQVGFDFLGIKWRIYIDYGVTVLDYRGLYKNPGKAPA